MAGIGFELRKLFIGSGMIRRIRAYGYAGIISAGPMILAIVLLLGAQGLAQYFGGTPRQSELLVVLLVYALLWSLLLSSLLQMFLSRFVADCLYQDRPERVLPSLFGGTLVLMVPGAVAFGLFLSAAPEIPVFSRVLAWILFLEAIVVWLQMAYITAAKDYRRILLVYLTGVLVALVLGALLLALRIEVVRALLAAIVCGYGIMIVGFTSVLLDYFPTGSGSPFAFVSWFAHTPDLIPIGFLAQAGAFVHLILMWFGPLGVHVTGLFRHAPTHDAAAFMAFLVSLPTSVNFVVSVEVHFYRKYRRYFSAIAEGGTLSQVNVAQADMAVTLNQEIIRLAQIQVVFMVFFAVLMRYALAYLGFTTPMIAMFQLMCVGYSAYAIGSSIALVQLYFNDRRGALLIYSVFFGTNLAATGITLWGPPAFYGLGLVIAGLAMFAVAVVRMLRYIRKINVHVYCSQPVFAASKTSFWTRLSHWLDRGAHHLDPM